MSTLWQRRQPVDLWLESFLASDDHVLDLQLIPYDCRASLAHARMLQAIGVLTAEELSSLETGLAEIVERSTQGKFVIAPGEEDGHTAIENFLTARCGAAGRKIHAGRSRNDQVLTAMRLWEKDKLQAILAAIDTYSSALTTVCARQGAAPMPGYTHMQPAMPTTVGMWLGSFADAGADDRRYVELALESVDQCPLGTAAGFGVPVVNLDRERTATELGFARVQTNPMYAQLSRGRLETLVLAACTQLMHGLNRLATDLLLFSTREFGLVSLRPELCTGSSFMPQKRNADVLELVRGGFHIVQGEETKIRTLTAGLMSGYNRDVQLSKGPLMHGVAMTLDCLRAMTLVIDDQEPIRRLLVRILSGLGFTVSSSADGASALSIAKSVAIDMVVADVMLKGERGPEIVERIRDIQPDTPVLFISGYADKATLVTLEGFAFLQKPFTANELGSAVRGVLAGPAAST